MAPGCSLFKDLTLYDGISLADARPPTNSSTVPEDTCNEYLPYILALVNILASGFCYIIGTAACQVRAQIPCFAVPLLLSTPVTFAFVILIYSEENSNNDVFGCTVPIPIVGDLSGMLEAYNTELWLAAGFLSYAAYVLVGRHVFSHQITKLAQSYR